MAIPLLDIRDLTVEFATRNGTVTAVKKVDISINKGETLGIVGESGSGKSVTSYALLRILDRAGRIADGSIVFGGVDVGGADERTMSELRGREMSMIFQNPRAALNPIRAVGRQIEDVMIQHGLATRGNARGKAIKMLQAVRIREPEQRYHAYPFELSGGMCQRIVIAIALACRPQLLIADEPTTGLDVTTQKAVMDLIVELAAERQMATLLITHDLGLAACYCDRIVVMEKGEIVESAAVETLFAAPQHPYTQRLMRATPRLDSQVADLLPADDERRSSTERQPIGPPLLEVDALVKAFGSAAKEVRAVDNLSFTLHEGESLGLVGESGCGKSTTSAMIMRLLDPTSGALRFAGSNIAAISAKQFAHHPLRSKLQMVFQDPTDSLNPRWSARRSIEDPLRRLDQVNRQELNTRVSVLAERVGLPAHLLDRFPHQLSGGQKARVGIARAIALEPKLLILDEPTAALDVSVQAVVLNLLASLREQLNMSYLFISHDLNVVRLLCDRVMVMQAGKIVEEGPTEKLLSKPSHEYTRALLAAIPHPPVQSNSDHVQVAAV
ncbi:MULTISPECIES: dipeptide ABC transporter ATP-binding protein [unclassified Halomonas]|uniref:dipeptide ABC transporter ATP-binding protein n=1 Tax=unclassified Halomonas TaxID=2609666 RepID=UPI001CF2BC99|nr:MULTISPECIES: ABC transporter ATP-binding protein [unclassified Halomonas]MCA8864949.1 ABC transporter ATP-binding protein [Halomonas sp. SBBP1]UZH11660.1 ABC transporter ATP-binding protein [Halomonas sp. BDJS001]